jgi:hypothetical protein
MALHAPTHRLAASLIFALAIGSARGAIASSLAYEGFDYLPGQTLPTMPGGTGWALGTWTGSNQMVDQPPSLSYPTGLQSTGDALSNPAPGESFRSFAAPLSNVFNDLWISFQQESVVVGSGAFVDLQPVAGFPDINVNKDGLGAITLNGIAAGSSAGVGNVDLFVLQVAAFSGGTSVINLFVDPGVVLGVPSASFVVPSAVLLSQFYYRSDPNQLLDEIRFGTTPLDVAAVPEPGTLLLLGAGLASLAASRGRARAAARAGEAVLL